MKAKYLVIVSLLGVISYGAFERVRPTSATMCNSKNTVKIIDQGVKVSSVEAVSDANFKSFINSITDHVQAKEETSCVELIFVRVPLVASANKSIAADASRDSMRSPLKCQLDSPWAKVKIGQSNGTAFSGVFSWNERQFLVDQAVMSGMQVSPAQSTKPIDKRTFEGYVKDYTDSVLLAPSEEVRAIAGASIEKRLPPEILWLFRNAWQSTRGPFSTIVDSALKNTIERGASGYTDMNLTLVNQCFTSAKTQVRYRSILDLKSIFTVDKYRINKIR